MNYGNAGRIFCGAVAVYLVMAACSAAGSIGASGDGGTGVAVGAPEPNGTRSPEASPLDAFVSPVPTAQAAPAAALEESTEPCSKHYADGALAGFQYAYAEHAYAGASVASLGSVAAIATVPAGNGPPGYTQASFPVWVRAGTVAAVCGVVGNAAIATSITFVRRVE